MNDIVSTLKEIIFERMRRKLVITVENGGKFLNQSLPRLLWRPPSVEQPEEG